jgi:hypothetical protein
MENAHIGKGNTRGKHVGTKQANPDRPSITRWMQIGPFEIPVGPRYADGADLREDERPKS